MSMRSTYRRPVKPEEQQYIRAVTVIQCTMYISAFLTAIHYTCSCKANAARSHIPAAERESPIAAAGFGTLGHAQLLGSGQVGWMRRCDNQSYAVSLHVVLECISFALWQTITCPFSCCFFCIIEKPVNNCSNLKHAFAWGHSKMTSGQARHILQFHFQPHYHICEGLPTFCFLLL